MLKNHSCGELNREHIGSEVTLAGWVDRRRDHGGLIFIDLRDREGIVQVVFNPEVSEECHRVASDLRSEYVVRVKGRVTPRPKGTENPNLATGEIEVIAESSELLNPSKTPPFYINEEAEVEESLRLKYRYLDLRRPRMKENLLLRHRVVKFIRDFLDGKGFIEVETPILIKSTPEGARDYLVPSRIHTGKFYALPQSPQQLKQLLMVAGIDKYFQIARCFRDEDTRADRQPEFTQLDLEMSFAEEEDVLNLVEELFTALVAVVKPARHVLKPFPHLTYAEAMARYGTDKPDVRFGLEIKDLTDIAARSNFSIFQSAIAEGGIVAGISAPGCASYTRAQLNELNRLVQGLGAGGLVTISLDARAEGLDALAMDDVKSVAAKFLTLDQIREMANRLKANPGDLLLIIAGKSEVVGTALGALRQETGQRLKLADPNLLAFAFITGFPLLRWNEKSGRWEAEHHPFTAPQSEDIPLLDKDPGKVRGRHYDIICNGYEIGGGSIRIHSSKLQKKVFRLMGYGDTEVSELFGHMLEAFNYGAPPHGGIAPGMDRIVRLITGDESIGDIIPFPKTLKGVDLMSGCPSKLPKDYFEPLRINVKE